MHCMIDGRPIVKIMSVLMMGLMIFERCTIIAVVETFHRLLINDGTPNGEF